MNHSDDCRAIQKEIDTLEERLRNAKARLNSSQGSQNGTINGFKDDRVDVLSPSNDNGTLALQLLMKTSGSVSSNLALTLDSPSHSLLLLSDSALPLGSFAFSSGLESYLAHHRTASALHPHPKTPFGSFNTFLPLSLAAIAASALPYVLAGYRHPERIWDLDNDYDASTVCTVARRASVAQGKALLAIWERSFKQHQPVQQSTPGKGETVSSAQTAFLEFSTALRSPAPPNATSWDLPPNGHYPPLWGLLTSPAFLTLTLQQSAYVFLFNHAKALLSAAVRASVLGPYQAQAVLGSPGLQAMIRDGVERNWERDVGEAGLVWPTGEIWAGRHEMLYSRIFNS